MAAELLKELEKEVQCAVCLGTVSDPKSLQCLHSFCLNCLNNVRRRRDEVEEDEPLSPEDESIMACPVCRMYGEIPYDLADLPTSFHINRLMDILARKHGTTKTQICSSCKESDTATRYCFVCLEFMCSACFQFHHRTKRTRHDRKVLIENFLAYQGLGSTDLPLLCSQNQHDNDKPLKYYCQECQVSMCQNCCEASHDAHKTIDFDNLDLTAEVMQMRSVIEKVKQQVVEDQNRMNKQAKLMEKSKEENLAAQKKVAKAVEDLISVLRENEKAAKAKLQKVHEAQQKDYTTQLENFQLNVSQLKSFVKYGEAVLETNQSAKIFQAHRVFLKQGEELLNLKKIDPYYPQHVDFVVLRQVTIDIQDDVVVKYADALRSEAQGKGLEKADVGTETNFTLTVRDQEGKEFYHEDNHMNVEVINAQGEYLKKEMKDHKDGKYTVTYTPQSVGTHTVVICVNGKALAGSPWNVQVMPHRYHSVIKFGTSGREQGQFDWPVSVAVSKKTGNIAIADCDNKRIQLFSSKGEYLREFGNGQNGMEKLSQPNSVAYTSSGNIIVLDHSKIFYFDEKGRFMNITTNLHLKNASSISVGHDDQLIVSDKGDKKIKVLSPNGTVLMNSFSAPNCHTSPEFAICHQNRIFVSFFEENCVKVFDTEGHYLYDIGGEETEFGGCLSVGPLGLAVNSFNHLVVCYLQSKELYLFTLDGQFVSKIRVEEASEIGTAPYSVAVSDEGRVIMVDILQHSVTVFQ